MLQSSKHPLNKAIWEEKYHKCCYDGFILGLIWSPLQVIKPSEFQEIYKNNSINTLCVFGGDFRSDRNVISVFFEQASGCFLQIFPRCASVLWFVSEDFLTTNTRRRASAVWRYNESSPDQVKVVSFSSAAKNSHRSFVTAKFTLRASHPWECWSWASDQVPENHHWSTSGSATKEQTFIQNTDSLSGLMWTD